MKDKQIDIRWEGLFLDDNIETNIKPFRDKINQLKYIVNNYHVTTEYNSSQKHKEFYGESATVSICGFVIDDKIINPQTNTFSSASGFIVSQINASNNALQKYIDGLNKMFHMTTSYSRAAVDMNYADCSKMIPCQFQLQMKFGGYDVISNKVIFNRNEVLR